MKKQNVASFLMLLLMFLFSSCTAFGADFMNIPIVKVKTQFLSLYREQWKLFGTEDSLNRIIDEAIEEHTKNLMWGTVGLQLGTNYDGIVDKIQEAAGFKFSPIYEKFIAEIEDSFADILKKEILEFYDAANSKLSYQLGDNPMAQANLRQDYDTVVNSQGAVIINDVSQNLSKTYGDVNLSAYTLGAGLMTIIAKKFLQKKLQSMLIKKAGKTALGKIAGAAVPIAGWIMLAWGAWDIYTMATGAEDTVRQQLHELNQSMYTREIPLSYWEGMEPYVRDAFIFTYERLENNIDRSYEIQEDPAVQHITVNMSKPEKMFFASRVAVLDEFLKDYSDSKENLFKYFGQAVRDVSASNFETFVLMLREGNWEELKDWVDSVGIEECCNSYKQSPKKFWTLSQPPQTAVRALNVQEEPVSADKPQKVARTSLPKLAVVTDLDKMKFINKTHENFINLFIAEWDGLKMSERLNRYIDDAVAFHTRNMMWGTVEIQLRSNTDNVINKIQDLTDKFFSKYYSAFIMDLEDKFGEILYSEIVKIYKNADRELFINENNPMKLVYNTINASFAEKREEFFNKWLNEERSYVSTDGISKQFYDINYSIYVKKLPEFFWKLIQPYVEKAFNEACSE